MQLGELHHPVKRGDGKKGTHLVLHLDINETVLIGDEAGGDTNEDCLNKMLAKSAFVRMPCNAPSDEDNSSSNSGTYHYDYERTSLMEPTQWWDGTPIRESYSSHDKPPPLRMEWEWPTGCCPYYRTKFKSRAKTFVSHHGSIYKELYDELEAKLHQYAATTASVNSNGLLTDKRHRDDNFPEDIVHFIPALFETLIALSSEEFSEPCTVCFRTFGTDLSKVAKAVNAFCTGQHPAYPDFRSDKLMVGPDQLVQGRWKTEDDGTNNGNSQGCVHVYQLGRDGNMIASGDENVLEFLHSHHICGIQDDYRFWKQHNYEPWSGKPVWIPHDRRYHHILFDDNIHNLEHDCIASIRRQTKIPPDEDGGGGSSFQTLSSREILQQHGVHLIRVPTIAPILNPRWFIDQIAMAQTKFCSY